MCNPHPDYLQMIVFSTGGLTQLKTVLFFNRTWTISRIGRGNGWCPSIRISVKSSGWQQNRRILPRQSTQSTANHWIQYHASAKYLGLTIDNKLNYNEHVNNICKKANSTRAFIHRNTRSCPRKVEATAYTSFVRPQLEYVSTVWGPHTANNTNQIEAVQRRAARSVMNDWHSQPGRSSSSKGSPTLMMQQLGWNTLGST